MPDALKSDDLSDGTPKNHVPKDRQCQFCHQAFTSSSLGRHLDQFIFKKKADGIHNVDEIRMQRGGVTRRSAKHEEIVRQFMEEPRSVPNNTSSPNGASPAGDAFIDLDGTPERESQLQLNAPNWHSTGVINGLPDSHTASPAWGVNATRKGKRKYSSIETTAAKDIMSLRGDFGSEKDTARAFELALREVLDAIQAARATAMPPSSPFPIDIPAHSFPSLVLHLLPPAPSLLASSTPFPTPTSFPISSPPTQAHHYLLQSTVMSLVASWTSSLLHQTASKSSSDHPKAQSHPADTTSLAESHKNQALEHVNLAYEQFSALSPQRQVEVWTTELARAFASEQREKRDLEARLEAVLVEARQLSDQVQQLSRCQWPREMALWPPDRKPIGKDVLAHLKGVSRSERSQSIVDGSSRADMDRIYSGLDEEEDFKRWDFDTLVNKWRKIVRDDAGRKRGLPPATTTPSGNVKKGKKVTASTPIAANNRDENAPTSIPSALAASTSSATETTTKRAKNPPTPAYEAWSKRSRHVNAEDGNDSGIDRPGEDQYQDEEQDRSQNENDGEADIDD